MTIHPVRLIFAFLFAALWFYVWGNDHRYNGKFDAFCYSIVAVIITLLLVG